MICRYCNEEYDDNVSYRHNECRKCYNERLRLKMRERASTPEGYLKQIFTSMKNDKRWRKEVGDLTSEHLIELYYKQNGKCALSGLDMVIGFVGRKGVTNPYACSVDRIDNNMGYSKDNVRLVLQCVNYFKLTLNDDEMLEIARKIVEKSIK